MQTCTKYYELCIDVSRVTYGWKEGVFYDLYIMFIAFQCFEWILVRVVLN